MAQAITDLTGDHLRRCGGYHTRAGKASAEAAYFGLENGPAASRWLEKAIGINIYMQPDARWRRGRRQPGRNHRLYIDCLIGPDKRPAAVASAQESQRGKAWPKNIDTMIVRAACIKRLHRRLQPLRVWRRQHQRGKPGERGHAGKSPRLCLGLQKSVPLFP